MSIHQSELIRQQEAWKAARARLATGKPSRIQALEAELGEARRQLSQAKADVVRVLSEVEVLKHRLRNREATIKRIRLVRKKRYSRRQAPVALPDVSAIIACVLGRHPGVTWEAVQSRKRNAASVAARHDCIVAVRKAHPGLSYPSLGKIFRKHHTTIMDVVRAAE